MRVQLFHRGHAVGTGVIRGFTEEELIVQIQIIEPDATGDVEDADNERQKKRFETLEKVSGKPDWLVVTGWSWFHQTSLSRSDLLSDVEQLVLKVDLSLSAARV